MTDRDEDLVAVLFLQERGDPAGHGDLRPAGRGVGRLDLLPRHAAAPAGAERLEDRLLDGEAAGQVQVGVAELEAVVPFARGENPVRKS